MRREARPAPEELTMPPSMRTRRSTEAARRATIAARAMRTADRRPGPRHARRRSAGAGRTRRARPRTQQPAGNGVWFTVNVGRSKNADPKWLIPFLCRRGDVTKRSIGKIQILARETRVEIAPTDAAHFAEAIRRPDTKDKNLHIEPVEPEASRLQQTRPPAAGTSDLDCALSALQSLHLHF